MKQRSHINNSRERSGFTLIELLVVTAILAVLLTLTLTALRVNAESDRIRKGARQLQSYIKGAQDRAIWSQSPVGIRLYVEPSPESAPAADAPIGRTVTSIAYIGRRQTWPFTNDPSIALVNLERANLNGNLTINDAVADPPEDANGDGIFDAGEDTLAINGRLDDEANIFIVRGFNDPGWFNLHNRGYFDGNQRIRIPAGPGGEWYPFEFFATEDLNASGSLEQGEDIYSGNGVTAVNGAIDVASATDSEQLLRLLVPYHDQGSGPSTAQVAHTGLTYEIELPWQVLAEEPCILPEGVVIDLDASKVPDSWRPATTGNARYAPYLDIVFSPQGNVVGEASAAGLLHFYVCDREDSQYLKEEFIASLGSLAAFDAGVPGTPFIPLDEVPSGGWISTGDAYFVKERRIVSIFGQTGHVGVSQVNTYVGENGAVADSDGDDLADDPYRFAETGEEAN